MCIAENVKNLTSRKFASQFQTVLASLEQVGYNNYWKVLNLKNFGIPQNRERIFIVSIRKDIDNDAFNFPRGFPLKMRLKDMLEDHVDERYYMDKGAIERMNKKSNPSGHGMNGNVISEEGLCSTLTTNKDEGPKFLVADKPRVVQIGNCCTTNPNSNPQSGRVYDIEGLSPTLTSMTGGHKQPFVMEESTHRIRKLTPKECFRLMGFDDVDYEKAAFVNSNHQLYKQAGNSIGVPVVEHIMTTLFDCGVLHM